MYPSLQEFLKALDQKGELKRIAAAVSPLLEITLKISYSFSTCVRSKWLLWHCC